MLNQIEAKIPRIDFIQADVDGLVHEWERNPQSDTPIHVRLMVWLKHNAMSYGYEQSGNSWILKR